MWPWLKDKYSKIKHDLILNRLHDVGLGPPFCEVVNEPGFWVVNYMKEREPVSLISSRCTTGFAVRPGLAHLKAICEWTERQAMISAAVTNEDRFNHGSDGCAAFPVQGLGRNRALSRARQHALAEAIERYVWSKWWDDNFHGYSVYNLDLARQSQAHSILETLARFVDLESVLVVRLSLAEISVRADLEWSCVG